MYHSQTEGQTGVPYPDGGTDRQVYLSLMEGQTDRCTLALWRDRQTGVPYPDGGTDRQVYLSLMEGQIGVPQPNRGTVRCTLSRWRDRQMHLSQMEDR